MSTTNAPKSLTVASNTIIAVVRALTSEEPYEGHPDYQKPEHIEMRAKIRRVIEEQTAKHGTHFFQWDTEAHIDMGEYLERSVIYLSNMVEMVRMLALIGATTKNPNLIWEALKEFEALPPEELNALRSMIRGKSREA